MLKYSILILLASFEAFAGSVSSLRCVEGSTWVEFQNQGGKEYVARVHRGSSSETIEYLACDVTLTAQGAFRILDCAQSRWDYSRKKKGIYVQLNSDHATFTSSQYIITGLGVGLNGMIPDNVYRAIGTQLVCEVH